MYQIKFTLLFIIFVMPVSVKAIMDDREFFESLDQNYPGLEEVRASLASGDTALAKIKLLEYYQNRTSVHYFELTGSGKKSDAKDNLNHYFTVIDIRKYAGQADGTIDWTTFDPVDREWHYQFHRMYWLINLGKVYGSTGDEKYAIEWIAELLDWSEDNSPGYPRTLDTGVRLRNWVESYQYFVHKYRSPSITAEDHVSLLKSLMEQCRFLRDNWRDKGNWGASETRGLGAVVIMFPEFKFARNRDWNWWRDLVLFRLEHHLSGDFYPDGVQFETSPSYHSLEYRNLFLTYNLINLNGIPISDALKNLFIKPLEFMMHIHKPDGYLPQLSDTDRKSYRNRLEQGAELFNRQDMIYSATMGKQGVPPRNTFAPFHYGGYFVMRSDWGQPPLNYEDTKYLVFDTGSNEPWHAHYDILNFEAYANKTVLVRDPGRYTYVSGYWRDYFKNSTAHNTIVIDNQNQKRNTSGTPLYWTSLPGFDYVSGKHSAYSGLTHERRIFFVKPEYWIISDLITGSGNHNYDLYFHLDSPYLNHTTFNESDHSVATPNFIIVPSETIADAQIIQGWVSNSYNSKAEAPIAKFQKTGLPPLTFETILFPYQSVPVPLVVEKLLVHKEQDSLSTDKAFCLKIMPGDQTDWFFYSNLSPTMLNYKSFQCDALAALVRVLPDQSIPNIELVQGSFLNKGDTLLVDIDPGAANVSCFQGAVFIDAEDIEHARIWSPQTDSVVINGESVNSVQDGNYIVFEATAVEKTPVSQPELASRFQLEQNYPNPFNQATVIKFVLLKQSQVRLQIFNLLGQKVHTLLDRSVTAGEHKVTWNGTDEAGQVLPGGIYFCRLQVGAAAQFRCMVLLK